MSWRGSMAHLREGFPGRSTPGPRAGFSGRSAPGRRNLGRFPRAPSGKGGIPSRRSLVMPRRGAGRGMAKGGWNGRVTLWPPDNIIILLEYRRALFQFGVLRRIAPQHAKKISPLPGEGTGSGDLWVMGSPPGCRGAGQHRPEWPARAIAPSMGRRKACYNIAPQPQTLDQTQPDVWRRRACAQEAEACYDCVCLARRP